MDGTNIGIRISSGDVDLNVTDLAVEAGSVDIPLIVLAVRTITVSNVNIGR